VKKSFEQLAAQNVTREFVESFTKDLHFEGVAAQLVATGYLPQGVDGKDKRVKRIVRKCRDKLGLK
jgi:hypothetical protein